MGLYKDVLYVIAQCIDDPPTWFNFALVSMTSARICKELEAQKMDQFAVHHSGEDCHGSITCTWSYQTLPNGNMHGKSVSSFDFDCKDQIYWYYNGVRIK